MAEEEALRDMLLGSLVSLTSKTGIRYEGTLAVINLVDRSIVLKDVKFLGTEDRDVALKVPPSDTIYDKIMFQSKDIKDVEVKSSTCTQDKDPIFDDPAVIQAHCSEDAFVPTSCVTANTGSSQDSSSHASEIGLPPNLSSGPRSPHFAPPPPKDCGFTAPMHLEGSRRVPDGLQTQQQSSVQPRPAPWIAPSLLQRSQDPAKNESSPIRAPTFPDLELPKYPPPIRTSSWKLRSNFYPGECSYRASASRSMKAPIQAHPFPALGPNPPLPVFAKASAQPSRKAQEEVGMVREAQAGAKEDVEMVQASPAGLPVPTSLTAKRPLLHFPPPPVHRASYPAIAFKEDFDFEAMNEKFNKAEVWGNLGKSFNSQEVGSGSEDQTDSVTVKAGYAKDEFFDSLTSNFNRRTTFSERMRIDTETFGEEAWQWGSRGRGWGGRGRGWGGRGRAGRGYPPGGYPPRRHGNTRRGSRYSMSPGGAGSTSNWPYRP
ncbi:protein decapping 5-like isoform X2 [Diospyros lotus]|uniref:protein decapping 5-like isoform X2 n=1 Tax=Diospyros lotus TaxID=55363 RepID=UPI00225267A6|nr:protein decapping 5-like isoform X2 [Diospyros lotus]